MMPTVGVAGAGYWGKNLIRVCAEMGVLESVSDPDPGARRRVADSYPGVEVIDSFESMLRTRIDAVVIAAPASRHATMALDAFSAGKHVFVEKPLALTVEDAKSVVRAAERTSRTLCVGHLLLYHPGVQALLGAIRSGAIGNVRHVRSRRLSFGKLRAEEDVVWSFAPHDVALLLAIFDRRPRHVHSSISAFVRPDIGDFAYAAFDFDDGRSAHVEVSWLDPNRSSRVDVFGERGVLSFCDNSTSSTLTLAECGDRATESGGRELWRGPVRDIEFEEAEPLRIEIEAFLRATVTGESLPTGGENGLRVVEILSQLSPRAIHRRELESVS
jgi:UDP-2-acetamido-3-amino-2,3-dideoxy-glucuronate N-acetyltransferase